MTSAIMSRKQTSTHEDWIRALDTVTDRIPYDVYAEKRDRSAMALRDICDGKRVAYAWSGGKDSLALQIVAEMAGVRECVLVITDLEYPAFLQWVTSQMPALLHVESTGQDMAWLGNHPDMLFPQDAATAGRWFKQVQHTGQERYYRRYRLDGMLLGRRRMDGNFVGRNGQTQYTSRGVTRISPIADWTHDDVLACIVHEGLSIPPNYTWPRGFRVGTGPWPARQWCHGARHGFSEVAQIDRSLVVQAARDWPDARAVLENA